MLVYQSRNSPGWGQVQPHAFGFRDETSDTELEVDGQEQVIDLDAAFVAPERPGRESRRIGAGGTSA